MTTEQHAFVTRSGAPLTSQQLVVAPLLGPSLFAADTTIVLSAPMEIDLAVYRGDSGGFRISVKNSLGDPLDVTEATWDSDIRLTGDTPTVITNFDIVPVDGEAASIDVVLTPENSNLLITDCVYDVEMTLDGNVKTLVHGAILVTQDVSRA